jgi:predicted nucleotide-binding protein
MSLELANIFNRGQTVIKKFEAEGPDAAFAVILLTPDDQGGLRTEKGRELKPRARQNVVFEFGLLRRLIGRSRVAALVPEDEEPESPSDLSGPLYIPVRSDIGCTPIRVGGLYIVYVRPSLR